MGRFIQIITIDLAVFLIERPRKNKLNAPRQSRGVDLAELVKLDSICGCAYTYYQARQHMLPGVLRGSLQWSRACSFN